MTDSALPLAGTAMPDGLALIQGMFAGLYPGAPMARLMDSQGGSAGPGWVSFIARPGPQHYNPLGTVHGGFAATLLDSAMGCAVHTRLGPGVGFTTVDLNVTYLRPMTEATGLVTARGDVISCGRRIATARGTLTDADGKLIATGITTCMILPMQEAA